MFKQYLNMIFCLCTFVVCTGMHPYEHETYEKKTEKDVTHNSIEHSAYERSSHVPEAIKAQENMQPAMHEKEYVNTDHTINLITPEIKMIDEDVHKNITLAASSQNLNQPVPTNQISTDGTSYNLINISASNSTTPSMVERSQGKLQSRYENAIQDALGSYYLKAEFTDHDLSNFINKEINKIAHYLLKIHAPTLQTQVTHNLINEIKSLSDAVRQYNPLTLYSNINDTIIMLERMNIFLKYSHLVLISPTVDENIDKAYISALAAADSFKLNHIVLNTNAIPSSIQLMFDHDIKINQQLANISDTMTMMDTVYGKQGAIESIIQSLKTNLTTAHDNINDQYQIEFLAFVLIFQDTIAATIALLNQASKQYKVITTLQFYPIY